MREGPTEPLPPSRVRPSRPGTDAGETQRDGREKGERGTNAPSRGGNVQGGVLPVSDVALRGNTAGPHGHQHQRLSLGGR